MEKKIITDEKGNVKIQRIYSQAELAVIRQKSCALQCRQEVEMLRKRRKENQVKEVKEYQKEYHSRPEVKEHRKEYNRKRYLKRKTCVSATIPSTSTWQGTILNVSKR